MCGSSGQYTPCAESVYLVLGAAPAAILDENRRREDIVSDRVGVLGGIIVRLEEEDDKATVLLWELDGDWGRAAPGSIPVRRA